MVSQTQAVRFRSSARRPSPLELVAEALSEAWSRRRLIRYLVEADLHKKGADTIFGNIWWILDPLLQMLVYVVLVSIIFQRSEADYPLFIFAAILPWKWLASTIQDAIGSITGQDRLIKQVKFPKLVLPVAATMAGIAQFAFGLIPLAALLILFYHDRISPYLVLIPVVAAVQLLFSTGLVLFLSAINVFYRDVGNVSRHALRMWFYLSPALYGPATIEQLTTNHHIIGTVMKLNPMFAILESYRNVIYYGTAPDWAGLAIVAVESAVFGLLAIWFFKRLEPAFAKVL